MNSRALSSTNDLVSLIIIIIIIIIIIVYSC
jgi:hypothetical protein